MERLQFESMRLVCSFQNVTWICNLENAANCLLYSPVHSSVTCFFCIVAMDKYHQLQELASGEMIQFPEGKINFHVPVHTVKTFLDHQLPVYAWDSTQTLSVGHGALIKSDTARLLEFFFSWVINLWREKNFSGAIVWGNWLNHNRRKQQTVFRGDRQIHDDNINIYF